MKMRPDTFFVAIVIIISGAVEGILGQTTTEQDTTSSDIPTATPTEATGTSSSGMASETTQTPSDSTNGDATSASETNGTGTLIITYSATSDYTVTQPPGGSDSISTDHTTGSNSMSTEPTAGSNSISTEPTAGSDSMSTEPTAGSDSMSTEPATGSDSMSTEPTTGSDSMSTEPTAGSDSMSTEPATGSNSMSTEHTAGSDAMSTEPTTGSDSMSPEPATGSDSMSTEPTAGSDSVSTEPTTGSDSMSTEPTAGSDSMSTEPERGTEPLSTNPTIGSGSTTVQASTQMTQTIYSATTNPRGESSSQQSTTIQAPSTTMTSMPTTATPSLTLQGSITFNDFDYTEDLANTSSSAFMEAADIYSEKIKEGYCNGANITSNCTITVDVTGIRPGSWIVDYYVVITADSDNTVGDLTDAIINLQSIQILDDNGVAIDIVYSAPTVVTMAPATVSSSQSGNLTCYTCSTTNSKHECSTAANITSLNAQQCLAGESCLTIKNENATYSLITRGCKASTLCNNDNMGQALYCINSQSTGTTCTHCCNSDKCNTLDSGVSRVRTEIQIWLVSAVTLVTTMYW